MTDKKFQILIIEDDAQLRDFLRQLLEEAGYTVQEAPDGIVARETLKKRPIDLVITDIFMPKQEGIGTIIELTESHPQTKIIAISGGGSVKDVDFLVLAENLGAQKVFQKPFSYKEMLTAVRELLQ